MNSLAGHPNSPILYTYEWTLLIENLEATLQAAYLTYFGGEKYKKPQLSQ